MIEGGANNSVATIPLILDTPRLLLRRWTAADEEPFHAICSDSLVMRFVGDGQPWSRERTRAFVEDAIFSQQQYGFCRWPLVLKESGALIGFGGFVHVEEGAEIGWRLASHHWGQGLASEAAIAVLKYGFESLHFQRVNATVQSGNSASIRIIEKLGMKLVDRFERDSRDVLRFSLGNPMKPIVR